MVHTYAVATFGLRRLFFDCAASFFGLRRLFLDCAASYAVIDWCMRGGALVFCIQHHLIIKAPTEPGENPFAGIRLLLNNPIQKRRHAFVRK